MFDLRFSKSWMVFILITALATACGGGDEEGIAVSVALTQTAVAQDAVEATPTEEMPVVISGDLQPLVGTECDELAEVVGAMLAVDVSQRTVEVQFEGKTGAGCQVTAVGTGVQFTNLQGIEGVLRGVLEGRGWVVYETGEACLGVGGWGPGANVTCYNRDGTYCGVFAHINPSDPSLCPDDMPITECMMDLAPEQEIYTFDITCARDTAAHKESEDEEDSEPVATEPITLFFNPGDDHIQVPE